MDAMELHKTGTRRSARITPPQLPDEIIWEILVLLPVKPLLRFKRVCKAWRRIITDPAFIRAHLRRSASRWENDPSFVISPITVRYPRAIPEFLWPTSCSNHLRFYQWKQADSSMATCLHDKDFNNEFCRVLDLAHCDGLVLVPTDTGLHLFNPGTRDVVTLPGSERSGGNRYHCVGLGLDPSTGDYKVVQAFYRPPRCLYRDTHGGMGMEALTVGFGGEYSPGRWREIDDVLPYPVKWYQTGVSVNGFIFWHIDKRRCRLKQQQPPRGILRLSLKDEEFSVTELPDLLDLDDAFVLDVIHGREELCLTAQTKTVPVTTTIWTMSVENGERLMNSRWERRYNILVSDLLRPMAILPDNKGIVLWNSERCTLYRYESGTSELTTLCEMESIKYKGRRVRKWKELVRFDVRPFTESLVRITKESFLP